MAFSPRAGKGAGRLPEAVAEFGPNLTEGTLRLPTPGIRTISEPPGVFRVRLASLKVDTGGKIRLGTITGTEQRQCEANPKFFLKTRLLIFPWPNV